MSTSRVMCIGTTIYFRIPNTSGSLHVEVLSNDESVLPAAREVWDRLSKQFEMTSARP